MAMRANAVMKRGPNWIHGTNDNPMLKIAKETGTELHAWDESQAVIDSEGYTLDPEEAGEYARLLWDDGVIAAAFKHSNEHSDSIPASQSLYDFFIEKATGFFTDRSKAEAERKRKQFLQTASMWGAYVGDDVRKQTLKFFWLEECIEGENPFVAGTYTKILDAVAKPAREKADIRLNTKVTGIRSDEGTSNPHSRPVIETSDGSSEEFDEVVITAPLGYLKRNADTMFNPPLPPRLTQAISSIGYGNLDKVYITFPSAFWEEDTTATTSSSPATGFDPSNATPNVTSKTAPLHQPPSNNQHQNHYPGFTHWLAPTYAPDTNRKQWDQQAMNFAALPGSTAHPTLLFYIYGDCAKHIASLFPTNKDKPSFSPPPSNPEIDAKLTAFFTPYISRLPHYNPSNPSCTPSAILATAWAADEFAGYGSYSNFQTGAENLDKDIEALREGCPERGVWFAGEHTAPFVALGTSTGAYWAGEGVAGRIVGAYGLE